MSSPGPPGAPSLAKGPQPPGSASYFHLDSDSHTGNSGPPRPVTLGRSPAFPHWVSPDLVSSAQLDPNCLRMAVNTALISKQS